MRNDKMQQIATFRFGVIHDLVGNVELSSGEQERLIREKCDRKRVILFSTKTRISRSTILRWVKLYKESGGKLDALVTRARSDQGLTRTIDEETGLALIRLREEFPRATISHIISEMNARGLVRPGTQLATSTVYRFLHRRGLMKSARAVPEDRRRFEAEHPNDLWQCDCMHVPVGEHDGRRRKTCLLAFIDDHSRLVPHAEFYLSDSIAAFVQALEEALAAHRPCRRSNTDRQAHVSNLGAPGLTRRCTDTHGPCHPAGDGTVPRTSPRPGRRHHKPF